MSIFLLFYILNIKQRSAVTLKKTITHILTLALTFALTLALTLVLALALSACDSIPVGVSRSDYDTAIREKNRLQDELDEKKRDEAKDGGRAIYNLEDSLYALDFPVEREFAMLRLSRSVSELRRLVTTMALYAPYGDAARIDAYHRDLSAVYSICMAELDAYESILHSDPRHVDKDARAADLKELRVVLTVYKDEICDPVAAEARTGNLDGAIQYLSAGSSLTMEIVSRIDELTEYAIIETYEAAYSQSR